MLTQKQRELARIDPAAVFDTPEQVAASKDLSDAEKLEILRRWRYDAIELNVAADEGMGSESSTLLDRIVAAIDQLDPGAGHEPGRHS